MMNLSHADSGNVTGVFDSIYLHPAHLLPLIVVSCFGLVMNSLSAAVWFKRSINKKPGTFYLGCLSVADALFCLSYIYVKPLELSHGTFCSIVATNATAYLFTLASRLMTIAVVAQRWLTVSRTSPIVRFCRSHGQFIALPACSLCFLGFIVIEIYTGHLRCKYNDDVQLSAWFKEWQYISAMLFFVRNIILFVCLIVFSILLLYASCTMKTTLSRPSSMKWHRTLEQRMSIIVSCIVASSLLEIFAFLLFILVAFGYADLGVAVSPLQLLHQWILVLNSSINFVFYVSFGRDFRRTMLSMCSGVVPRLGGQKAKDQEQSKDSSVNTVESGLERSGLNSKLKM